MLQAVRLEELERTPMFKHVQTKIDGWNAIISHWHLGDNWRLDVIMCTDQWSPVSAHREITSDDEMEVLDRAWIKYGLLMSSPSESESR